MARYFNCGSTKIPSVGLGTWQTTDENEVESALAAALQIGYRHIDTSYVYENEQMIGKALKKFFDSGKIKREELFITTKCPIFGVHPTRVEKYMKESLQNLQLDYVDLYLLHFSVGTKPAEGNFFKKFELENPTDHVAIWKKMEEQQKAGRTKSIGLSNFNIRQIKRILESATIPPAVLQVEVHVFLQQPELVKFCHDNNISVIAYSPLATPLYNIFLDTIGEKQKQLPDALNDPTVAAIAKKHGKTNAQILLRFLVQNNIGAIPRSVSPTWLQENITIYDFSLDVEDLAALKKLDRGEAGRICDWKIFKGIEDHPEYPFKT